MGTTESTLNDPSDVQHPAQNATPVKVTITTPSKPETATAISSAPRIPRSEVLPHSHSHAHSPRSPTTTNIGPITPHHHSTTNPIESASNTSPRASKLKVLKGAVCGREHVGKSSLMYRLRGEENKNILAKRSNRSNPNRKKRRMMALIPWTMESSSSADSTLTTSTTSRSAKQLQRDGNEGETVQLHIVELHEEHYSDLVKRSPIDFLILVIDRTNRDSLDYVLAYLDSIVDATANGEHENVHDLPSICILLNHYDAIEKNTKNQGDHNNSEKDEDATDSSSQTKILSLQVVQSIIENRFKSLAHIRYIDACMNNGYGIEALDSFISLPYLQVKERELVKQLEAVRQGLTNWEKDFEKKKFVSFEELEEFCKQDEILEDRQQGKETLVAKGRDEAEKAISAAETNDKQNRKYGKDNGGDNNANKESRTEQHSQKSIPDTRRRNIMPRVENKDSAEGEKSSSKKTSSKKKKRDRQSKSMTEKGKEEKANVRFKGPERRPIQQRSRNVNQQRKPPVYKDPKQALEAFLASDDDSEDSSAGANDVPTTYDSAQHINHGSFRNMAVLDSDSDDSSIDTSSHRAFEQIRVKYVDSSRNSSNPKSDNDSEVSGGSQKASKGEVTKPVVVRRNISASESEGSDANEKLDAVQAPDCVQDLEDHAESQSQEKMSNTFGNSPPSDKSADEGEGDEDKVNACNSESDSVITEQEVKQDTDNILPNNADRSGEEDKERLSNSDAASSTTEQGLEHEGRGNASKDQAKQADVVSRDVPELDIDKKGHDHLRSQKEQGGSNDNEDSEELSTDQDGINDSNSAYEQPILSNEIHSHDENCERNLSALKPIEKEVENDDQSNDLSKDKVCRTTSDCSIGDNSNDSNIKSRTTSDCSIEDRNRVHIDAHQTEVAKSPDLNDRIRQEQYSPSDAYESLEDSDGGEARLRTKKDERQHILPYPSTNAGPVDLESDSDDDFIVEDTQDERITMTKARKNMIIRNKINYPAGQNRTPTREQESDPHVSDDVRAALLLAQKEAENTLRDAIATERNPKPKKSKKAKKSDSSMKQKKKKKKSSTSTISYI